MSESLIQKDQDLKRKNSSLNKDRGSSSAYDLHLLNEISKISSDLPETERNIQNKSTVKIINIACLISAGLVGFCLIFSAVVLFFVNLISQSIQIRTIPCTTSCKYTIVETIPQDMQNDTYFCLGMQSHEAVVKILSESQKSVKMLQFYFNLENDAHPLAYGNFGNSVFKAIVNASKRHGNVEIIYNKAGGEFPDIPDMQKLSRLPGVKLRSFDFGKLFGGVLHTKLIIVDDKSFFLGSVNMDWKSYSQVKELAIFVEDCECLAHDLTRIFYVFQSFHASNYNENSLETAKYNFETLVNIDNPIYVPFSMSNKDVDNGTAFFSSSPKEMNSEYRTNDIVALIDVINSAKSDVRVSVMDFFPVEYYETPKEYWSELDSALKSAIFRNVSVKLLISKWNHTKEIQVPYLKSLKEFSGLCYNDTDEPYEAWCTGHIKIKLFVIPDNTEFVSYNFTRVNHPKYVVTESKSYISTSNWSKDYFYSTAGVSITLTHETVRNKLKSIFERDWNSVYAHNIDDFVHINCNN